MKQYIQIQTYCICVCLLLLAGCTNEVQTTGENPEGEKAIELKIQVVNPVVSRAIIEAGTAEEDKVTHCDIWLFEENAAEDALPLFHKTEIYFGMMMLTKTELETAGLSLVGNYKIYAIVNLPEELRELVNDPMRQSMQVLKSIAYTAKERPSTAKSFCMTGGTFLQNIFYSAVFYEIPVVRLPVKLAIQINDKHRSGITVTKLECLNDQQIVYMSAPVESAGSAPFAESLNIPFQKKGADTLAVATAYINENLSNQPIQLLITGTLDGEEKKWRAAITPDDSPMLLRNTAYNITLNLLTNSVSTDIYILPWDVGTKQESMNDLRITNCYIVPPGGQLFVPYTAALQARRMLWGDKMDADQQIIAEVIWADTRELANGVTVDTKNELEVVDVHFPKDCQGNLVVGIKKAGESAYLWSWHLWVTDYDPSEESGQLSFDVEEGAENDLNKKRRWMDRNLGAMTNQYDEKGAARGLCYQWGRKDPFPGSTGWAENPQEPVLYTPGGGTASVSVKNINYQESFSDPLAFGNGSPMWCTDLDSDIGNLTSHLGLLWSKDMMKTLFDPCPYGWRSSNFSIPRASDFVYSNKGRQGEPYGYWPFTESRTIAGPQKAIAGNYWSTRVDYYISRLWFFDEIQVAPPAQRPPNHSDAHSIRCVKNNIL